MFKIPKKLNTLSLSEQEEWFVNKLQANQAEYDFIKSQLGKIRGGQRVISVTEERPDEELLKAE